MLDLKEIRRMNAHAGTVARSHKIKPFLFKYVGQLDSMPPFPFPNFGDKADDMDKEYERVDSLFCDSSGWGLSGEMAMTPEQLKRRLKELFEEHGHLLLAIESTGEFQVYVGVWKEKA